MKIYAQLQTALGEGQEDVKISNGILRRHKSKAFVGEPETGEGRALRGSEEIPSGPLTLLFNFT